MSQENVERVRAYSEAFKDGDVSALHAFWHPDLEWRDPPETPDASVLRGRQAVEERLDELLGGVDELRVDVEDIIDGGAEEVVLVWRLRGRWRGGMPLDQMLWLACGIRDGKIFSLRNYLDERQALDAVGLQGG